MIAADLFVIGGGPAGLVTAIAARRAGLSVTLADGNHPPVDKACGEGLLPDAVAALEALGIAVKGHPLRGIRFLAGDFSAQAEFPHGQGLGVRRVELHNVLRTHAEHAGADLRWGTPVNTVHDISARWIIGADGASSRVRKWARLEASDVTPRRYAHRRHYAVAPWTDYVEVYWSRGCQMYVTPVGEQEVGIAFITSDRARNFEAALSEFPRLAARVNHACMTSRTRGAVTATTRLARVTSGNVAVIGDASGTVDAITGEGLGLAFRQSAALAESLAAESLYAYEKRHRSLAFRPRAMARALLLLDRHPQLLQGAVRLFAAQPAAFRHVLALHVGG